MAGNNSIQFVRGTSSERASHTETSLAGQPIYETDTNRLYVGDGETSVNDLTAIEASAADIADNVKTNINGKAITSIFERDGTTAKKATQDASGNVITSTYATKNELSSGLSGKANTSGSYSNLTVGKATNADNAKKAEQDANGNVIDETYAKLSQVVRTDTAQTLPDWQKQIARNNTTTFISKGLPSAGWYRIAELNTTGFFELEFNSVYFAMAPSPCKVFVSWGSQTSDKYSLTSISSNSPSSHVKSVRLILVENKWYVDFYYDGTLSQDVVGIVMSGISYSDAFARITPINFTPVDDTGTILTSLDITAGINTTGGVYQNGAPVFATDPSKLEPSTANGWTEITPTGSLPSAGVYLVGATIDDNGTSRTLSPCIMVFDGTNPATAFSVVFMAQSYISYFPSQSTKWVAVKAANYYTFDITSVYYKRIA